MWTHGFELHVPTSSSYDGCKRFRGFRACLQPLREDADVFEVDVKQLPQARPLHLDDNRTPTQFCQVHLGEGILGLGHPYLLGSHTHDEADLALLSVLHTCD